MRVARGELALLKAPPGMTVTDERVELGEMDAFGAQTYCVPDGMAGQKALDSMLRSAGWEPVPAPESANAATWNYRKGNLRGSLRLDAQQQPCGRRFVVSLIAPL